MTEPVLKTRSHGCQSMVTTLRRVLVRRPDAAFAADDYQRWGYTARPDLEQALAEHEALVTTLRAQGVEVLFHDLDLPDHADAIFVHDPVLVCERGAIILRMGKPLRRGEEEAMATVMEQLGVPIHYRLHGDALAEGGDLLWLDEQTLAAGLGFRTNAEGVRQLQEALAGLGVTVLGFDLSYHHGPASCLHLMSAVSMVDHDLAVVYPPLLPVAFWQLLQERGITLVEVPEQELETMGPNVLAMAPRVCLMLEGNPVTRQRLERAGCRVLSYRGNELSLKAEGGATCLTRPILRDHRE